MKLIAIIKVIFYGIVEGITEWLPISSTGHLILFESFWPLDNVSESFMSMFRVVIQLGAILAVIVRYFHSLNPWDRDKDEKARINCYMIWVKIIAGCIPAGIFGLLLDDFMEEHLSNWYVVSAMLILYGIAFIYVEKMNKGKKARVRSISTMPLKTALAIGCFQTLSIIPGTSRSGSTILGAMVLGVSRPCAAGYSFFLAIPVISGYSFIKVLKFLLDGSFAFSMAELATLILGMGTAFIISLVAIHFLMVFVKKHNFTAFGWYRIGLGVIVILYHLLR